MKILNYIIKVIKKYCYILIPLISIIVLLILNKKDILKFPQEDSNLLEPMIGISGTLIGFLFTAMTIFFSLNKDSKYMQNLKRYNHHIIFSRLVVMGILFLTINIVLWLFNLNFNFIIISFIIGLEETIMCSYYIYVISLNSFK